MSLIRFAKNTQGPVAEATDFLVPNPKRTTGGAGSFEDELIFPYYAGFSMHFALSILGSLKKSNESIVVDPWNGSGTVTSAASRLGIQSIGVDLNPVMVLVAKARLLSRHDVGSLVPLGNHILDESKNEKIILEEKDLLFNWFDQSTTKIIRQIEKAINCILVDEASYSPLTIPKNINKASSLCSFYYVSLFRMIRSLLNPFTTSNPTWIKKAKNSEECLHITRKPLHDMFIQHVTSLSGLLASVVLDDHEKVSTRILPGDSASLPIDTQIADFILTSPPYCTRIDYAVATSPELAIIGINQLSYNDLRNNLLGTSSIHSQVHAPQESWGQCCNEFLKSVRDHDSKASRQYYLKNHCQYFNGLHSSFREINRILKIGGVCGMVVQDSYYKDLHNDLPRIVCEMANGMGLQKIRQEEFSSKRSMVAINPRAKKYKTGRSTVEQVIFLQKTGEPL